MLWRFAADGVLLFHLLFILFAILGGLGLYWKRRLVWLHLPALIWAALVVLNGWLCPLTPLEVHLRELAGESGYEGSFIAHYLLPLIYPPGLTRDVQVTLGVGIVLFNLLIYGIGMWRHWRR